MTRGLRVAAAAVLIPLTLWAGVATNAIGGADEIPPLRPPKAEIPPSFWEEHGIVVILAAVGGSLVLIGFWRLLVRREPKPPRPPAEVAREALQSLRERPQDADLLGGVSRVLRDYFVAALELSDQEYTNTELSRRLQADHRIGAQLTARAGAFLEGIEPTRFDSSPNISPLRAVEDALDLVEQTEQQLRSTA